MIGDTLSSQNADTLSLLQQLALIPIFFSNNMDESDIYGKAVCYDGMYQIAKKKGEWKTAVENMEAYKIPVSYTHLDVYKRQPLLRHTIWNMK